MELSVSVIETTLLPSAAFVQKSPSLFKETANDWQTSRLNPKNRVERLESPASVGWRIDGCSQHGIAFNAVPLCFGPIAPNGVDVFVTDQCEDRPAVRDALGFGSAFHMSGGRVTQLGIAGQLALALTDWAERLQDFRSLYENLPWGSAIQVSDTTLDHRQWMIDVVPNYALERRMLPVATLERLWSAADTKLCLPPSIDLRSLVLISQPHASISLVSGVPFATSPQVFKSIASSSSPQMLYHELKNLLSLPAHPNVTSRPLYLVTKKVRFGGKVGVCGFIQPYHASSSLQMALPSKSRSGKLTWPMQLRWAGQVTSALIHICQSDMRFYPDLRADNVLLKSSGTDPNEEDALLIDLEQRGNHFPWTAPNVNYLEYLLLLSDSDAVPEDTRAYYLALLAKHLPSSSNLGKQRIYNNPTCGFNRAWLSLSPQEAEAAMVYSLGKLLWCIFEGVGSLSPFTVRHSTVFSDDQGIEFPEFKKTPLGGPRTLIRRCTAGAPEWEGRHFGGLVRKGNIAYPRDWDETLRGRATADDAVKAAQEWWKEELKRMDGYLSTKDEPGTFAPAMERPCLTEVLRQLESFETQNPETD
jgi:hypothetical protein